MFLQKLRFEHRVKLFTSLTVFSGSSYAALAVVSSNVFGLDVFSCGLTPYELRKLSKIKIINCVLIENIPQLFFQVVFYTYNEFTMTTLFASLSSGLSVLAAGLSWFINERNTDEDMEAVHHYLALECDAKTATEVMDEDDCITADEKSRIELYRGWRLKLSRSLTKLWRLPDDTIQIGNTLLTANGAETHIVHLMNKHTMKGHVQELFGHRAEDTVSAMNVARQFYRVHQSEISQRFRSHFQLDDRFNVMFYDREESTKEEGAKTPTVFAGDDYFIELRTPAVSEKDKKDLLKTAVNVFFTEDADADIDFEYKQKKLFQFTTEFTAELQLEADKTNTNGNEGGETEQQVEQSKFMVSEQQHAAILKEIEFSMSIGLQGDESRTWDEDALVVYPQPR